MNYVAIGAAYRAKIVQSICIVTRIILRRPEGQVLSARAPARDGPLKSKGRFVSEHIRGVAANRPSGRGFSPSSVGRY